MEQKIPPFTKQGRKAGNLHSFFPLFRGSGNTQHNLVIMYLDVFINFSLLKSNKWSM